jgi:electron transfer flavoprotein alpha/beta subunit
VTQTDEFLFGAFALALAALRRIARGSDPAAVVADNALQQISRLTLQRVAVLAAQKSGEDLL